MASTVGTRTGGRKSFFWFWQPAGRLRWLTRVTGRVPAGLVAGGVIMTISRTAPTDDDMRTDWAGVARELAPRFAARAAAHDAADTFVADNYAELRERRVFAAGVP